MALVLVLILAVVQGLTEFLPVSSSGHLVVTRALLEPYIGTLEAPLAFDIFVHLATALVTAFFLRSEIIQIIRRFFLTEGSKERQLVTALVIATLPAVVVGLLWKEKIEELFATPTWALNGFLLTAFVLELAHRRQLRFGSEKTKSAATLDWHIPSNFHALMIGCAQAMAIMPGVSRAGSTIAVGLLLGLSSRTSVLFSFFMLLPVVAGAILLQAGELSQFPSSQMMPLAAAFIATMVTAYVALHFLVWAVEGVKLRWFALYTLTLGIVLRLFI